jgi:hypothetical protein
MSLHARVLYFAAVVSLAAFALNCGGGGDTSSSADNPTAPTTVATADPATADWTQLAGQLAAATNAALRSALGGSAATAQSLASPLALQRPSGSSTIAAAFFCCGNAPSTSHLTVESVFTVSPADASGFTLSQTIQTSSATDWASTSGVRWRIETDGLRVTGQVVTAGTSVRAEQQFRLQGALTYFLASGVGKRQNIDVALAYANVETSGPVATGQMGPAPLAGGAPLDSNNPPQRCSLPREGCGPLANGDAPCTKYPVCPR